MILFWKPSEKYGFLSNWSKHSIEEDGIVFKTCEHYVMYHKAILMSDLDTAKKILSVSTPFKAKQLGRTVKGFDESKWDTEKVSIMIRALQLKATQHEDIKQFLINTECGTIFVEASPYDRIWGIGLKASDANARMKSKWRGQNLLGDCWTRVKKNIA